MCLYGAERVARGSLYLRGLFGAELVAFCLTRIALKLFCPTGNRQSLLMSGYGDGEDIPVPVDLTADLAARPPANASGAIVWRPWRRRCSAICAWVVTGAIE